MARPLEQVKIAVQFDNGEVRVMSFLTVGRGNLLPFGAQWIGEGYWSRLPTNENIFYDLMKNLAPGGAVPTSFVLVPSVPLKDEYRASWRLVNGQVVHDMPLARQVHFDKLRAQRAILMLDLDAQWMRALGRGLRAEADAIEAQRETLRNMTVTLRPAVDAATTIAELRAITLPAV